MSTQPAKPTSPGAWHVKRKYGCFYLVYAVAVLAVVFWLLSRSISPAPPSQIDMTTEAVSGAAQQFALKCQALPTQDVALLTATTNLMVREDLHPALGSLMLDMEQRIQSKTLRRDKVTQAISQLDQNERDVSSMKFLLDFTDRVYTLRQDMDCVWADINIRANAPKDAAGTAT